MFDFLKKSFKFCRLFSSVLHFRVFQAYSVYLNLPIAKNEEDPIFSDASWFFFYFIYASLFSSLKFHQNCSGLNAVFMGQLQDRFR